MRVGPGGFRRQARGKGSNRDRVVAGFHSGTKPHPRQATIGARHAAKWGCRATGSEAVILKIHKSKVDPERDPGKLVIPPELKKRTGFTLEQATDEVLRLSRRGFNTAKALRLGIGERLDKLSSRTLVKLYNHLERGRGGVLRFIDKVFLRIYGLVDEQGEIIFKLMNGLKNELRSRVVPETQRSAFEIN